MGLYATVTSLQNVMVGTNLTTTSTLAAELITRAERRINSALARRYDLSSATFQTSTSIPPQLRDWSAMLAEGYMWKALARGGAGKESLDRGNSLVKEVLEDLKLINAYELELVDTMGSVIVDMSNTASHVLCNTTNYASTFDEGDELAWEIDPNKLDAISSLKG